MGSPSLFVSVAAVLASVPMVEPVAVARGRAAVQLPSWAPFAFLAMAGTAWLAFAILNPEMIAAMVYAA